MNARPDLARAAAAWVVRLSADGASESEWRAFREWLDSHPDARLAYDRALGIWLMPPVGVPEGRAVRPRPPVLRWALAASLAGLLVVAGAVGFTVLRPSSTTVLQTQAGERRSFDLGDGSRVTLGQDSQVVVEFGPRLRRVVMRHGDAGFAVAEQALRPFRVIVGDDALTVVHTQFGVHRRDGRLKVVVRQGAVAVGPAEGETGPRVRLTSGDVLDHVEGTQTFQVGAGDPQAAFAW